MMHGGLLIAGIILLLIVAAYFAYQKCVFGGKLEPAHCRQSSLCGGPPVPGARAEQDGLYQLGWRPGREGFGGFGEICGGIPSPKAASQALAMRQLAGGRYVDGELPGVYGASSLMDHGLPPDVVSEAQGLYQVGALPAGTTGPTGEALYSLPNFGLKEAEVRGDGFDGGSAMGYRSPIPPGEADGFANRALRREQATFTQLKDRRHSVASVPGRIPESVARFTSMREGFGGEGFGGPTSGFGWVTSDQSPPPDLGGDGGYGWLPSDDQAATLGPDVL